MTVIVVQVILATSILVGGFIKVFRVPFQVEHWNNYHYPLWFMSVIGFIEIIGAIGMFWGIWNSYLAIGSGIVFEIILLGAIHTHIFRAHQSVVTIIPALVSLIFSIIVVISNL